MKLYIAILCGLERTGWLCPALVDWILAGKVPAGMEAEISLVCGYWPVDHARNVAVKRATQNRADWLFMVDNDQGPHSQTLEAIALADARGLDVVGFATPILTDAGVCPNVQAGHVEDPKHDEDFEEVPECGAGVVGIRTSVFARLARPYFEIGRDEAMAESGLGFAVGEDLSFCRKARAAGLRLHITRGIPADHFKTLSLLRVFESQAKR